MKVDDEIMADIMGGRNKEGDDVSLSDDDGLLLGLEVLGLAVLRLLGVLGIHRWLGVLGLSVGGLRIEGLAVCWLIGR
jgi:hypothetical protein